MELHRTWYMRGIAIGKQVLFGNTGHHVVIRGSGNGVVITHGNDGCVIIEEGKEEGFKDRQFENVCGNAMLISK